MTRTDPAGGTGGTGDGTAVRTGGTGCTGGAGAEPLADCVLCGEPTEYPNSTKGATLCPVCAWQEAQRTACSG